MVEQNNIVIYTNILLFTTRSFSWEARVFTWQGKIKQSNQSKTLNSEKMELKKIFYSRSLKLKWVSIIHTLFIQFTRAISFCNRTLYHYNNLTFLPNPVMYLYYIYWRCWIINWTALCTHKDGWLGDWAIKNKVISQAGCELWQW